MNKQIKRYRVLGLMSGTSLDGLDLCLSDYSLSESQVWKYKIIATKTLGYSNSWLSFLRNASKVSGEELISLHFKYGTFLGESSRNFLEKKDYSPLLIASHGHTIFHQPEQGFTFQLGHPASIAAGSGFPVVADFRSLDLALGGQGAPLVPFGDEYLFSEYSHCFNFGGICNVSYKNQEGERIAYDICPFNMVLNYLSQKHFNRKFDQDGLFSAAGKLNQSLVDRLNQIPYYQKDPPKSLGREWVFSQLIPIINQYDIPPKDKMRSFCHHIVDQISKVITDKNSHILISGGGAKNKFIIELLRRKGVEIQLPSESLIDFKEALIFGFLGLKRYRREENILSSSTGSKRDSSSACIYYP